MNKSILLSIRPEWVLKMLTHKKTIEARKKFPKDYKGWVYIYCTKTALRKPALTNFEGDILNGKVVARFWCDCVDILNYVGNDYACLTPQHYDICEESCLEPDEIYSYLNKKTGYAIHISKLEIFNEPRELNEFGCYKTISHYDYNKDCLVEEKSLLPLIKAPQNYCYVEGEE